MGKESERITAAPRTVTAVCKRKGMVIQMKKNSIFRQLLLPMIAIVCALAVCLTGIVVSVFAKSYEREAYGRSQDKSQLVSGEIATFLDGAFGVTQELAVNPSILTMETGIQTPILEDCVRRNSYLELLYIQGTDGMQTGRSSGELTARRRQRNGLFQARFLSAIES